MRYTFKPDDCMVITVPLNNIKNAGEGQLMPDQFSCRFKDNYKVFQRGHPKALGVAQIVTAVFILCLVGIMFSQTCHRPVRIILILSLLSILYLVSGSLTIAAAHTPLMPIMKASFVFNILGLCLVIIVPIVFCLHIATKPMYDYYDCYYQTNMITGLTVMLAVLYMFEFLLSVLLIHWESKAICRTHFNSLPVVTLKQDL